MYNKKHFRDLLDKKLKNNDKYIIDKIMEFLDEQCYFCGRFISKIDIILVYTGKNCVDENQKYCCSNCIEDKIYCENCKTYHIQESMYDLIDGICNYCQKNNFRGICIP